MSLFDRTNQHAFAGPQCEQCNGLRPLIERVVLGIQQIDLAVHRLQQRWLPGQNTPPDTAPPQDLKSSGLQTQLEWGLVALERSLRGFDYLPLSPDQEQQQRTTLRLGDQFQSVVPRTEWRTQGDRPGSAMGQNTADSGLYSRSQPVRFDAGVHRILPPLPLLDPPSSLSSPFTSQKSGSPLFQQSPDPPSSSSSSDVQIQYLRNEISSKTVALQNLQRDYDTLLTNVITQSKHYVSDSAVSLEKTNLEKKVRDLQAQVTDLLHAQEEVQRESTASRNQYLQIMSMSTRLQAQSATDARRWQAEKEEWDKQRTKLLDRIQQLEQSSTPPKGKSSLGGGGGGGGGGEGNGNDNDGGKGAVRAEQKCRLLERHIRGLDRDTVQLDEALQTTLRLSASIRAKIELAQSVSSASEMDYAN